MHLHKTVRKANKAEEALPIAKFNICVNVTQMFSCLHCCITKPFVGRTVFILSGI